MQTRFAKHTHTVAQAAKFALFILAIPGLTMAQPQSHEGQRWFQTAGPAPEFTAPDSLNAWKDERQKIRAQLWTLLGKLPPRPSRPEVAILSREDRGEYLLERFQFNNGAGATVPGYLLLPKQTSGKAPAILYCHWHGGEYEIGKEEVFRADHTPQQPGPVLAARGFAVMAIDAYCFGERNGQGPGGPLEKGGAGELTASKFNLWLGRTLWGMILRDDLMALDYLCSRPEIDQARIAVTGMSMGATRSWWLMALDERINTGVAVACLTRYQNLIQHQGLKYHGIYYYVPGILNHFDTEAVVALIAPRPLLLMNGDKDEGSPADGIRIIEDKVRSVYQLYDAKNTLENALYPGLGHEYTPQMWNRTLSWFDQQLTVKH
jgi:dienelactone hydrolase